MRFGEEGDFLQGNLSQISPKPTTCLTAWLPHFQRIVNLLSTSSAGRTLEQLSPTGEFATAAAKTYAPWFCAAIAGSVLASVHRAVVTELDAEFFVRRIVGLFRALLVDYEVYTTSGDGTFDFVPDNIPEFHRRFENFRLGVLPVQCTALTSIVMLSLQLPSRLLLCGLQRFYSHEPSWVRFVVPCDSFWRCHLISIGILRCFGATHGFLFFGILGTQSLVVQFMDVSIMGFGNVDTILWFNQLG